MNIALVGYGKMGKMIEQIGLGRGHRFVKIIRSTNVADIETLSSKEIDVAIEFSNPEGAYHNIMTCLQNGISVVSGTTGWLEKKQLVEDCCLASQTAFIHSTNFSIGVNLFFVINEYVAKIMASYPEYDVKISETHYLQKKDKPSGTAISLAEGIFNNNPLKKSWILGSTTDNTNLFIESERIEHASAGKHVITYQSNTDEIVLKHDAYNREGFALGALLAAEYIQGKKGVFTMRSVLGIE
ncbi:MAG: 4-hydroxy-tetrahydrodipicolinate reductase [Phycisphaerales bacterium]|nr:4-hydroxy-tetrahydrodipicolinate reductase [Phycisphaerales bacterium]